MKLQQAVWRWARTLGTAATLAALLTACANPWQGPKAAERLAKARALFAEHCKTAGEKIYRTVDNVEGIYLLKLRPQGINYDRQFALDDPYGRDLSGDGYIETFIRGSWQANHRVDEFTSPAFKPPLGYLYVQAVDPKDGVRYRYTGHVEEPWQRDKHYLKGYFRFVLDKAPASGPPPRYGVTYDDISTHEDREYWIAGSSLKVIDLQTNTVIAERVGYMMDEGQGQTSGGRSPWLIAADHSCPSFFEYPNGPHRAPAATMQADQTDRFVEKVLRPVSKGGDEK
jgi:hypothetical protein